jgi:hypothetical protein
MATATKTKRRTVLREDVSYQPKKELRVRYEGEGDNRVGIVEGVKILGFKSRNKGRRYDPEGVNVELYEGAPVNTNHPDPSEQKKPRDIQDRFGWVEGVHKEKDGLYAKSLKFNPKHPLAETFAWWAKNRPDKIGLSQNAFGDVYEGLDGEVVDKVTDVRSIDLVSDPATTNGLFEAVEDPSDKLPDAGDEDKLENAPGKEHGEVVKEDETCEDMMEEEDDEDEDEDDGSYGGSDVNDEMVPDTSDVTDNPTSTDADSDISDDLASAADKIFRSSDDPKVKLKKIKALLHIHHSSMKEAFQLVKVLRKGVKDLKEAKKALSKVKSPSIKLVMEALDQHEVRIAVADKKAKAHKLIESAKLPKEAVTPFFMAQLLECKDERTMQQAIEDRRLLTGPVTSKKPKSAGQSTLAESMGTTEEGKPLTEEQMDKAFDAFYADVMG